MAPKVEPRYDVSYRPEADIQTGRQMGKVLLDDPYHRSKLWHRVSIAMRRRLRGRIFAAIERGDDAKALQLGSPRNLNPVGEFGQSPLVAALAAGRIKLALEFVSRGGFYPGDGAMAHAAMRGHTELVEALLKGGKSPDEPLRDADLNAGYTPLMWAVNRRYLAIVKLLLSAGANVDAVAGDGSTAVMLTATADPESLEALDMLCAHQPDIHKKDWRGRSVVREAIDREKNSGKPQMREILERHFPGTDFEYPEQAL